MKARKQILSDHKRKGKILVPPFNDRLGPLNEISWIKTILPELLWIALIQYFYGHKRGVELITALTRATREEFSSQEKTLFAATSAFLKLSTATRTRLLCRLKKQEILSPLQKAVSPLISWYPRCPIAFLVKNAPASRSSQSLAQIKNVVSSLYIRSDRDPMMVQATAIWLAFDADIIKVTPDISLARFPEIEDYPRTEISRQIGGSIRAILNGIFGSEVHYSADYSWPNYFWNRGLEIDPCEFADESESIS